MWNLKKIVERTFFNIPKVKGKSISKELLYQYIQKENPVILDIGCNDGTHSLWFSEIFKSAKIYCFEPDPRAIKRFKENVGVNEHIKLFEIALSDKKGKIEFHQSGGFSNSKRPKMMPEGWDYSGSIREPKKHLVKYPNVTFQNKVNVLTETLDGWCEDNGVHEIDFIWMDVQGAEIDVFRGATKTLLNTKFIYTEYSDTELYEGQFNLRSLMRYLKDYQICEWFLNDVFIKNKRLK